jgi:hypothetical protein
VLLHKLTHNALNKANMKLGQQEQRADADVPSGPCCTIGGRSLGVLLGTGQRIARSFPLDIYPWIAESTVAYLLCLRYVSRELGNLARKVANQGRAAATIEWAGSLLSAPIEC